MIDNPLALLIGPVAVGIMPDMARQPVLKREQQLVFRRAYGTSTDAALSERFGLTLTAVDALANRLRLAKDKAFLKKLHGSTEMPRWTVDEVKTLRRLYPDRSNIEVARELNRSAKSVVSKAHQLQLFKSSRYLEEMGRANRTRRTRKQSA